MATPADWEKRASLFLKIELKRAGVTYEKLAERLNQKGFSESKAGITNKLARGAFTATFFLAVLSELGLETVKISEI